MLAFEKEVREHKVSPAVQIGYNLPYSNSLELDSPDPKIKKRRTMKANNDNFEEPENANYKFLMQKQVDKMVRKDTEAKKEHKERKR